MVSKHHAVPAHVSKNKTLSKGKGAPSSRKKQKAVGITPGKPAWGILARSGKSAESLRSRAASMFGTGGYSTPSGQSRLSKKAKRQVQ